MRKIAIVTLCTMCLIAYCRCNATVGIVVNTYDGLVVAADSRVTSQEGGMTRIASDFGEKVVRVGSHVAVMFAGTAYLLDEGFHPRSIGSIVRQYKSSAKLTDTTRVSPNKVACDLDSLLTRLYNLNIVNAKSGTLDMHICGYDGSNERRVYELTFPYIDRDKSSIQKVRGDLDTITQTPSSVVSGQNDVYARLIKGYDPLLAEHEWFRPVVKVDSTGKDSTTTVEKLALDNFRYYIRYDLMTLQDAIDFAVFIIRATIESQRFNQKTIQGVGGSIDIGVITTDGFRWIQYKELRGEGGLNPAE